MCRKLLPITIAAVAWLVLGVMPARLPAGEEPAEQPREKAAEKPAATAADPLHAQEQQIAQRYRHLEEVLLRMAELSAGSDPRRAALLRKAVAQSKDRLIGVQFDQIAKLLEKDQLSRAAENQGELDRDLKALLELLLSENRAKRIESERARITQYLRRLNEIIKNQKSVQGRTPEHSDPKQLAQEQGGLAEKSGQLAKDIRTTEESSQTPAGKSQPGSPDGKGKPSGEKSPTPDKSSGDEKRDAGKPGAKSPGEKSARPSGEKSEKSPGQPGDKPAEKSEKSDSAQPTPGSKDADGSKPSGEKTKPGSKGSGKSQPKGQPGQSQDQPPSDEGQDAAPPPEENPARKRIEAARERMEQAKKRLEEAKRTEAVEQQEQAIRELEQAKADLEKILRQLREEEMERTLAMLEVRFRKLLQLQREVLDGTLKLDKVPENDRTHDHEIESGRLSSQEGEIVVETDKALLLLREDGSSVAFPEAMRQVRQDMQSVVQRLAEGKVGKLTQSTEEEIIAALEEMLEAVKKAQKKLEDKKIRGGGGGGGQQDPALVDALAELRMIRAMQMRINTRTQRYGKLIEGEQADAADLLEAVRRLAERQQQIQRITRDLEMGKNR